MSWTVGKRLVAMAGTGLALVIATGLTGYVGSRNINNGMAAMGVASESIRNHMECDMMHDAIRADIMAGMASKDAAGVADAKKALEEHVGRLREYVGKNAALSLPAASR